VTGPAEVGPSPPQHLTVSRVGALRWLELATFRLAGGWVATSSQPGVAVTLAAVSRHAADRARMLADRLPRAGHLRLEVVTVPTSTESEAFLDAAGTRTDDLERVVVLGDGLGPALVAGYAGLGEGLSTVADASLMRVLPGLLDDVERDRRRLAECASTVLGTDPGSAAWSAALGSFGDVPPFLPTHATA
jgi:hypothetical protein